MLSKLVVVFFAVVCSQSVFAQEYSSKNWQLVWSDEFNSANGSQPDLTKWTIENYPAYDNRELEYYTPRPENIQILNGNLVIRAIKEKYTDETGRTRDYTSARINTSGLFEQMYGRFEARVKMPKGQGIWPAFWLLGRTGNYANTNWPECGEIDIMENIGSHPNSNSGTIHGPGYSGGNGVGKAYTLSEGDFSDDFHTFAIEWDETGFKYFVDDNLYNTISKKDIPNGTEWVFDHAFYIILNVAVGGDWPGYPDDTTQFPQEMLVDYVRVYQAQDR